MIELTTSEREMIRSSAGDLDTAGVAALEAAVVARLTKAIDSGVVREVTKNILRAAITAELPAGK
jgi:hypothetical protein